MFTLGGGGRATERTNEQEGDMLPPPPRDHQRRNSEDELRSVGSFSMLSQAQNMGSPTNIQFDLGRGNNQPPPQETNERTTPREMGGNADIAMTANLRPQPLGRGGATARMVQASPYSGFDEALTKWGLGTDTSVRQDLNWQRDVNGDSQKINLFKEIVGGL